MSTGLHVGRKKVAKEARAAGAAEEAEREVEDNVLFYLMYYDLAAFVGCLGAYVVLALAATAVVDTGGTASRLAVLGGHMLGQGWQAEITFTLVIQVFYSLSGFPFTIFLVSAVGNVFSHVVPTGYDERGGMHFSATEGLSPYIEWLHLTLRHRRVRRLLHPRDLSTLDKKLTAAKAWLARLHLRGRVSHRELDEMHMIGKKIADNLLALVPDDHALYASLFTSRQLVQALEKTIEKANAKAKQAGANVRAPVG